MAKESFSSFDEQLYLADNPDVAEAVKANAYESGLQHYLERGYREARYLSAPINFSESRAEVEMSLLTASGFLFVSGWCDDYASELENLIITSGAYRVEISSDEIYRNKRSDVELALGHTQGKLDFNFGFFFLIKLQMPSFLQAELHFTFITKRNRASLSKRPFLTSDEAICLHCLAFLNSIEFHGSQLYHLFKAFDSGLGDAITTVYDQKLVSHQQYSVSTFNPRPVKASIVCVLFGMSSPIRMIGSTAMTQAGKDFEWIFVNNSPEIAQQVTESARIVSGLHDASVKVIQFNGNVGFGLANNVAVKHAAGEIICIYNPDIVPTEHLCFDRILTCADGILLGALLYYADGTIMHNGMIFVSDEIHPNVSISDGPRHFTAIRVEHLD